MSEEILKVENVKKYFPVKRGLFQKKQWVRAVDGVSLSLKKGETLGLVGESGCGKTTLGRLILRLLEPDSGRILFQGKEITHLPPGKLRPLRRKMQIVFQDPYSSLNPRMRVGEAVKEMLDIHKIGENKKERIERVKELFEKVGLSPDYYDRYPHEFSGGQRQRICIARAIACQPDLVICDEPVSALDVSVQAQILNLFMDLQREFQMAYIFISHDLSVVRHISDRVAVMYLGEIVEEGPVDEVLTRPAHPYTEALLSAVPSLDPEKKRKRIILPGDVPSPIVVPSGCRFHPRCPEVFTKCREEPPHWNELHSGHRSRCWLLQNQKEN